MPITSTDVGFLLMQRLAGSNSVQSLVSDRIRPMVLNENEEIPAIRYEMVSTDRWGRLTGGAGEATTRVQFDCYGNESDEAAAVAEAVVNRLDGFNGPLGDIHVYDCTLDNMYDRIDPPPPGGKQFRKRRTTDFIVTHTRPIPDLT